MKSTTARIMLTSAAILVGVTAQAATGDQGAKGKHMRPSFEQLDVNSDGALTLEEIQAIGKGRFEKMDADGDGFITSEEIAAMGKMRSERHAARMMERLDANEDGKISFEEMKEHKGKGRKARRSPEKMFDKVDANGDGKITKEEFAEMKGHRKGWGKKHRSED